MATDLRPVFLLVVCISPVTLAYSTGADPSACITLNPRPGHMPAHAQETTSPFAIAVSSTSYATGGPIITVTLESRCLDTTFKGFLLTARHADVTRDQDVEVGSFDTPAGTKSVCSGGKSRTHTDSADKTSVVFQWTPPSTDQGPVVFRATFVRHWYTFWVDVHSDIVQSGTPVSSENLVNSTATTLAPVNECGVTTPAPTPPTTQHTFSKDPECNGATKGCFHVCDGDNCEFLMSWAPSSAADAVDITLKAYVGDGDRYMAFGLSYDTQMGNDSVTECVHTVRDVLVRNSFNYGIYENRRLYQPEEHGPALTSASFEDGILTCSFTRSKVGPREEMFNLDSTQYYIFLARGYAVAGINSVSDKILKHDHRPFTSNRMVSLEDTNVNVEVNTKSIIIG